MSCELMVKGVNVEEVWLKDQIGFIYSRRRLPVLPYRAPELELQSSWYTFSRVGVEEWFATSFISSWWLMKLRQVIYSLIICNFLWSDYSNLIHFSFLKFIHKCFLYNLDVNRYVFCKCILLFCGFSFEKCYFITVIDSQKSYKDNTESFQYTQFPVSLIIKILYNYDISVY